MRSGAASSSPSSERPARAADLAGLAERVRPVTLTREQRLPVLPALEALVPGGGLRRGSTVAVTEAEGVGGGTSLGLAVVAAASQAGSWVAAVGVPSLGLVAAAELGVALEHLVLVAAPERDAWGSVAAALVDGFDCLVVPSGRSVRPADARRLVARARERGAVLVQLGGGWPERADVELRLTRSRWEGIEAGHGHLRSRKVRVEGSGRGEAARPRRVDLWLPAAGGAVEVAVPVRPVTPVPAPAAGPDAPAPTPSRPAAGSRRDRPLRAVS